MTTESAPATLLRFEDFLPPRASRWKSALRIVRANPVGLLALIILAALVMGAVLADVLAPYSKTQVLTGTPLDGPSSAHFGGTDRLGRDIFSRMLYGSRISLYVGFVSVGLGTVTGALIGLYSGFRGGWEDLAIQRLLDVLMSIPALLLAMVVVVALGPGASNAMFAIAVVLIPGAARVVRSVTLGLKARLFVEAAHASGAGWSRILFRHILPSAIDEIMVLASLALGGAIIIEAALAFLGLGAQPPEPSWGGMLNDGRAQLHSAPHMVYVPALFISITVLSAMILGDTIRDVMDPRLRGSGRNVDL